MRAKEREQAIAETETSLLTDNVDNAETTIPHSSDTSELSEYEIKRLETIQRNKEMLRMLGLAETIVQQNMSKSKKPRKKKQKRNFGTKILPVRSTRSTANYSDLQRSDGDDEEDKPKKRQKRVDNAMHTQLPRSPRVRAKDDLCDISYDSLPDWFRDQNPLNVSTNNSGYLYVHKSTNGWQVQIFVTFEGNTKRLVHHGIFSDLKTAALAQSVASNDIRVI